MQLEVQGKSVGKDAEKTTTTTTMRKYRPQKPKSEPHSNADTTRSSGDRSNGSLDTGNNYTHGRGLNHTCTDATAWWF